MLPVPLEQARRRLSRPDAKRALGLGDDTVLLVSVAAGFKYEPAGGVGFLDLVSPVVAADPRVVVLAAGPSDRGAWRAARLRTGGRIRALGPRAEVDVLYQAADVYLDAYPIGSLTSFYEAGSFGAPLVSMRPTPGVEVLSADDPGVDLELAVRPATPSDFAPRVLELVNDAALRWRLGRATQAVVEGADDPDAWLRALDHVYERARAASVGPSSWSPPADDRPAAWGAIDEELCRLNWRPLGMDPALRTSAELLGPARRLAAHTALGLGRVAHLLPRGDAHRHRVEHALVGGLSRRGGAAGAERRRPPVGPA